MTTASAVSADLPVELDGSWGIGDKLHGGYLLATCVRAALTEADRERHPHPLAASAVYAAPPAPGPANVRVHELKAGRTIATYRVTLEQAGASCVELLLTAGRLPDPGEDPLFVAPGSAPVPIAPREQCIDPPPPPGGKTPPGIARFVQMRYDPATVGWSSGTPSGDADFRGWVRIGSDDWDPLVAQFILADTPPPAVFDLGYRGWVPTLQLQVILRRMPEPGGWQQIRQHALVVGGGLLDEDCSMWDASGRLAVQARQLAAYRDT